MNKLLVLLIIPLALSAQSSGVGQSGTISSTFSANGAASTPGLTISGSPYTGGTATTNFPQVYLNGGAGPTTFSTAGTYLGINSVSGFTGNLFDAHINGGSSVASINYQGNALFSGTLGVTGHLTLEGITSTGATGTGKLVFDTSPTFTTPTLGAATATSINKVAITAPTTAGTIAFAADNSTATLPNGNVTLTVASGQTAMPTGALAANTCSASATTATATGALTTDSISVTYASDPTGVTGYGGGTNGGITVRYWPTANTVSFKLCNETAGSITPGALNINWRVTR